MAGADWLDLTYLLGFMVLVSSALFARRLRMGQMIRYSLIWAAIMAALLLGYSFRDRLGFGDEPVPEHTVDVPRGAGPTTAV